MTIVKVLISIFNFNLTHEEVVEVAIVKHIHTNA